jgi:hypothetical protein
LITTYAPSRLRLEALDPYLWRDVDHIDTKKLWSYLANYLYLPRLRDSQVLIQAIQEGVTSLLRQENFTYATGWDEAKQRYLGLKAGELVSVSLSNQNLLVKTEVAQRQLDADEEAKRTEQIHKVGEQSSINTGLSPSATGTATISRTAKETKPLPPATKKFRRFYGSVEVDPVRLKRDIGQIADEVMQHLTGLNAEIKVTMEIQVHAPEGIPDHVLRTISENGRVLKFINCEFEEE